ncbi:MAG TPA: hypothetical protein VGR15_04725 [Bacteroidota bacterium]|nr:hypothetical protein [Bacteroidota bacterium]
MPKKQTIVGSLTLLLLSVGWQYTANDPVYFGKIYLHGSHLYIAELERGIRILDITNPSMPELAGHLQVTGNHDMATISDDARFKRFLYADAHADLIVFDVTDPHRAKAVDTIYNVFESAAQVGWGDNIRPLPIDFVGLDGGFSGCAGCSNTAYLVGPASPVEGGFDDLRTMGPGGSGRGGSMARFAIISNEYLYCIDYNRLFVLEVTNPAAPRFLGKTELGWGIETLFPYHDYLFIGGQNGMFIYSIANPERPEYLSTYQHVRSCDPVVVVDTLAYVTLRGGTRCGTVVSGLHVLNISDVLQPKLVSTYPLPQPMGLDVGPQVAYVCDDSAGVYVLDTSDPSKISEVLHIPGEHGYDAIKSNSLLLVASRTNISIYDVMNPRSPVLIKRVSP